MATKTIIINNYTCKFKILLHMNNFINTEKDCIAYIQFRIYCSTYSSIWVEIQMIKNILSQKILIRSTDINELLCFK